MNSWFKTLGITGFAMMLGLALCLSGGCENGKGGSSGSTLRGNVVTFAGRTAFYTPAKPGSQVSRIVAAVMDLFVTPAMADDGSQAITIALQGTAFTATTTDGEFEIKGIPAGSYTLVFTMGAETATYPIVIPDKATVELEGITISGGSVTIQKVNIEVDDADDQGEDEQEDGGTNHVHNGENEHEDGGTNHVHNGEVDDD